MDFSTVNYASIVLAALTAYAVGAVYYAIVGGIVGRKESSAGAGSQVVILLAELVLALILFVVLNDITFAGSFSDDFDHKSGIAWALILWAGLVAMPLVVNHRRHGDGWTLTVVDAIHWLIVMVVIGAILGWFGVAETGLLNGALTI